ncbi:Ribonuclease H-like superfamily protein [Gossypium australe]|uniref:Ribonuclease H-like superfamily protein n=1 Tax=Gossypium australe TaxID=47621 RepID=A0A5B6WZV6_9ROSI|nr:Ribonuclease H-like superfamily protein [Gossypium australe]
MVGRKKKWAFANFVNRFRRRIEGWSISCGEKVNIWNDAWLPGPESGRLSIHAIDTRWTIVDQLIDVDSGTLNREVICKIVDGEQASRILNIPIVGSSILEMLVWRHDASGEYSVKSGYQTLLSKKTQLTDGNLNANDNYKFLYKTLWDLQLPSKIKIHMWRLLKDYVPHFLNLAKRKLRADIFFATSLAPSEPLSRHKHEYLGGIQKAHSGRRFPNDNKEAAIEQSGQIYSQNNFTDYSATRKAVNRAVHALAMNGRSRQTPCSWVEEAPDSVVKMVEKDQTDWLNQC